MSLSVHNPESAVRSVDLEPDILRFAAVRHLFQWINALPLHSRHARVPVRRKDVALAGELKTGDKFPSVGRETEYGPVEDTVAKPAPHGVSPRMEPESGRSGEHT